MPYDRVSKPTDLDQTQPECAWPVTLQVGVQAVPSVQLELHETTVTLVRMIECGQEVAFRHPVWARSYVDATVAADAFEALDSKRDHLLHWAVGVAAFGSKWLDATIGDMVEKFVERRTADRERVARDIEKERARLEEERAAKTRIAAYFRKNDDEYVITIERGSDDEALWSIAFEESWERDRFWDWLCWHTDRFEEFAAFMKEGSRLDLERKLLREMLVTEQAVKKQGLGSGGRRPLRFWRGEL